MKKNKQGFTLIELLAIISILSIILLIAIGSISNAIEKSRENAFKNSVLGLLKASSNYIDNNKLKDIIITEIEVTKEFQDKFLTNTAFTSGFIEVKDDNKLFVLNVTDGVYCAYGIEDDFIISKGSCKKTPDECFLFDDGVIKDYYIEEESCTTNIIIPNKINNQEVLIIDSEAFMDKGITSVTFPDTLIEIKESAFMNNSINNIVIPSNIANIGDNAFSGNNPWQSILIKGDDIYRFNARWSIIGWPIDLLHVDTVTEVDDEIFEYTGDVQTFTALADGIYTFELWGAQGGRGRQNGTLIEATSGKGAYTKGSIFLSQGEEIHIYVGGAGGDAGSAKNSGGKPGYNGGGAGGHDTNDDDSGGAGGGATDIRLVSGAWNDEESLNSRIMVAAGGSGSTYSGHGSPGGALFSDTLVSTAVGATQTSGYAFGVGSVGRNNTGTGGSGAGGGYYGGNMTTTYTTPHVGSAGSSYISGYTGSVAITSSTDRTPKSGCSNNTTDKTCSYHYSNKIFINPLMIRGDSPMPSKSGDEIIGNSGNGYAKITYGANIFLNGDRTIKINTAELSSFKDEGATAFDNNGIDVSNEITSNLNEFNLNQVGTYIVTYSYYDYTTNKTLSVSRTIIVENTYDYDYTGDYQVFTVPVDGLYTFELWGAQGGRGRKDGALVNNVNGTGAYTKGSINLNKGEEIYIYVGGAGGDAGSARNSGGSPGYNGGGRGGHDTNDNDSGGAGGGSTDIRLVSGTWNDNESLNSRIMVAAGGSGSTFDHSGYPGGALFSDKTAANAPSATQTSGYAFGIGSIGLNNTGTGGSGAGGGYYGGNMPPSYVWPNQASAGSSYISGYTGSVAITGSSDRTPKSGCSNDTTDKTCSYHYSNKIFINPLILRGDSSMPNPIGGVMKGNSGNGYAKITYGPTISLNGEETITLYITDIAAYVDEGATAFNNNGVNVSNQITSNLSSLNLNNPGTHIVTYSYYDSITNSTISVDKTIIVKKSFEFIYTGDYQIFTAPANGLYTFELWGAQGGRGRENGVLVNNVNGTGAYTKGSINLNKGEKFYIYVGGAGGDAGSAKNSGGSPGYNGGGAGGHDTSDNDSGGAGGGSTDIRLVSGAWNDNESLNSRIMVAAGGSGSSFGHSGYPGGALFSDKTAANAPGATQTSGYAFGIGSTGLYNSSTGGSGAGGGYYGGNKPSSYVWPNQASAGSSYISGYTGSVAITSSTDRTPKSGCSNDTTDKTCSYHYSNKIFINPLMIPGASSMPNISGDEIIGNTGNGMAKITIENFTN